MANMTLSDRSRVRLAGLHPDLVRVVERAAEITPFIVTEGLRSLERQKELVAKGASRTLKSRHLTGHAVDLADIKATYNFHDMTAISSAMKQAAKDCNLPIEWGGDWKSFVDTPHYQLPWKAYPSATGVPVEHGVSGSGGGAVSVVRHIVALVTVWTSSTSENVTVRSVV